MTDELSMTEEFEARRGRLQGVAYRMLGSTSEAEDAVQDAWLRVSRTDTTQVQNLDAWLTTVVARVCLNQLKSRGQRRELSLDAPAAEPALEVVAHRDPEEEALLADSVGLAMLVVLDTLAPAERLAFVLHDMFELPFDDIAPIVGRSSTATRQLASRARRRVRGASPAADADLARQRRVVEAYLAATRNGDFEALVRLLDPDVVLRADVQAVPTGVPVVLRGALSVVHGALASSSRARFSGAALVDGSVGIVMAPGGRVSVVLAFEMVDERITAIDVIADPDRLASLTIAVLDVP